VYAFFFFFFLFVFAHHLARALERFLEYIMTSSAEITTSKDAKTLTSNHILEVINKDARLSFLKEAALKSCSMAGNYGTSGAAIE
jgi:hypothetical protein